MLRDVHKQLCRDEYALQRNRDILSCIGDKRSVVF